MKQARLIWTGLAVVIVAGTAALALASGMASKHTAAKSGACSVEAAAKCTPAEAAACAAKGKNATAESGCSMHGATAATADAKGQCPHMNKGADASACAMHGAKSASTASKACCASGAKATTAAAAGAACGTHGAAMAMDCDACADLSACAADISESGGKVQIVPLKNGLMYVYTAESSAQVRGVQAAVARHAERFAVLSSSAGKAKLCGACREMRGATASGKLTREVVKIESGCLTLVTSNDPQVVARLYANAGVASGPTRTAAIKS